VAVHPASIWLDRNWQVLTPGSWHAAVATDLIARDPDLTVMMALVLQRGIPLNEIAIAYVPDGIVQ
jgi:hypothetical protein